MRFESLYDFKIKALLPYYESTQSGKIMSNQGKIREISGNLVCKILWPPWSNGCIYKQITPPLVVEHAFPLTVFVCKETHVTFGGSGGIRSTARPELSYPCASQAKSRGETSRRGKLCDGVESDINRYANYKLGSLLFKLRLHI